MPFVPSSYSYSNRPAFAGDAADPAAAAAASSQMTGSDTASLISSGIAAGAQLISTGADVYSRAREEKLARDAAKRRKGKKKRKPAPVVPGAASTALAPAPVTEGMAPWIKWALGGIGVVVLGVVAWKLMGPSEAPPEREKPHAPRSNPAPRRPTPTRIKPAPASSASIYRDRPTERLIDKAVERAHGESYEDEIPEPFDSGEEEFAGSEGDE